jgi:hypothetical protein
MDPITALVVTQVASAGASAVSNYGAAMDDAAQNELNARLAETQALQRDTLAREDLLRAESSVRAARGANGLSSTSPNAMALFAERRDASDRDRLISRADDRQKAANYKSAAASSRSSAKWSLGTGLVKAAVPLAQYGEYSSWGKS